MNDLTKLRADLIGSKSIAELLEHWRAECVAILDALDAAEEGNRLRAEDIMTLGKMVAKAERERDEAEIRAVNAVNQSAKDNAEVIAQLVHKIERLEFQLSTAGCKRGQAPSVTQFCSEAVAAMRERDEARAALDAVADEIDCGCPNRDAALAAESKASLWRVCHLGSSCNARQAAEIRSMKDRTP